MSVFLLNQANLLQRLLCLLLCACSWNGPMPVLHTHETLRLSGLLQQHLTCFHRACGTEDSGFHWHFAFVRDIYGKSDAAPEVPSECADEAAFACATAGVRYDSLLMCEQLTRGDTEYRGYSELTAGRDREIQPCREFRAFFGTLLLDVPLRAMTRVYLI